MLWCDIGGARSIIFLVCWSFIVAGFNKGKENNMEPNRFSFSNPVSLYVFLIHFLFFHKYHFKSMMQTWP